MKNDMTPMEVTGEIDSESGEECYQTHLNEVASMLGYLSKNSGN